MFVVSASLEDRRRLAIATLNLYHSRGAVITDSVVLAAIEDNTLEGTDPDTHLDQADYEALSAIVWAQVERSLA